jgi:hypothetical protein
LAVAVAPPLPLALAVFKVDAREDVAVEAEGMPLVNYEATNSAALSTGSGRTTKLFTTLKNESDSPDVAALSACCGVFISSYQTRCGIISPSL